MDGITTVYFLLGMVLVAATVAIVLGLIVIGRTPRGNGRRVSN